MFFVHILVVVYLLKLFSVICILEKFSCGCEKVYFVVGLLTYVMLLFSKNSCSYVMFLIKMFC